MSSGIAASREGTQYERIRMLSVIRAIRSSLAGLHSLRTPPKFHLNTCINTSNLLETMPNHAIWPINWECSEFQWTRVISRCTWKVHMPWIRVHFGTGIVIMRHVGIAWIHLFTIFCPFSPGITISRSLEGKYTFLGGIWWVLGQRARISDLGRI